MFAILLGLLLLTLFIQGTYTAVPFLVGAVILATVLARNNSLVLVIFFLGLVFDVITLSLLGKTSLFLLGIVALIALYERKFETKSLPFVFFMSVISSSVYLFVFGSQVFLIELSMSVFFVMLMYLLFDKLQFVRKEAKR